MLRSGVGLVRAFIRTTSFLLIIPAGFGNVDAPRSLKGTGYNIGDTAFDFTGTDQFGNRSSLYDLYGQFVMFDYCAEWCAPCQQEARDGLLIQSVNNIANQGVHVRFVQVLLQDVLGAPATPATIRRWITRFQLSYPVWNISPGDYSTVFNQFVNYGVVGGQPGGFPTHVVLGPDLKIIGVIVGTLGDPTIANIVLTSFQTTPAYMVFNLVAQIDDYRLSRPTTLSLEGDLNGAIAILTDKSDIVASQDDRIVGACHSLDAFIDRLTKPSDDLTPAEVAQLATEARQVQVAVGCNVRPN